MVSEYSLKKIKQNLAMSFAYNAITISITARLLYGFTHSLILTPTLAALGWFLEWQLIRQKHLNKHQEMLLIPRHNNIGNSVG
jgi:hypothetical protein